MRQADHVALVKLGRAVPSGFEVWTGSIVCLFVCFLLSEFVLLLFVFLCCCSDCLGSVPVRGSTSTGLAKKESVGSKIVSLKLKRGKIFPGSCLLSLSGWVQEKGQNGQISQSYSHTKPKG